MRNPYQYLGFLCLLGAFCLPQASKAAELTVSAIPGADERDFEDTASRCLTPAMKALHANMVLRMEVDIERFGDAYPEEVALYRETLGVIWSAMEAPYCGYGSRGLVAVKKSYTKSVERARREFLKAVRPPVAIK